MSASAASTVEALKTLANDLAQTEWLPAEQVARAQRTRLGALMTHAVQHSAHFRARLHAAGATVAGLAAEGGLQALPVLDRRELQAHRARVQADAIPASHQPTGEARTSGSSGTPVVVTRTAVNQLYWLAFTLREHLWHRRDFGATMAVTRANLQTRDAVAVSSWGPPASLFTATGPAHAMPVDRPVEEQLEWLVRIDPAYLLTYPTNLGGLLDLIEARSLRLPGLRQLRTIGETVTAGLRERAMRVLNVEIADVYSSQELGVIAIQCPLSGLYHVMAEGCIVEVLDDSGQPCSEGRIGRLVVTDLHNFATPLVRYDVGDYAEPGPACPCGRGLPTLRRIVGRERNMVNIDGRKHWPLVGFHRFRDVAPVVQYQLVQRDAQWVEFRLVCAAPLGDHQRRQLAEIVREALGHPFEIDFKFFADRIPVPSSGKFEEFVSWVV